MAAVWRPKISEIHKVDFEHFKNRYHHDEPDYAVVALVGPPNLDSQIRDEDMRRRRGHPSQSWLLKEYQLMGALTTQISRVPDLDGLATPMGHAVTDPEVSASTKDTYIHRIRIQSQPVLGHLLQMLGQSENRDKTTWPRTFFRPFKALVHLQPWMKEALVRLETKWSSQEAKENPIPQTSALDDDTQRGASDARPTMETVESRPASDGNVRSKSVKSGASDISIDENTTEIMRKVMDSTEALRDMRCYVDFVDREIMPRYDFLQGDNALTVTYDDLWCLFRLNELVYCPSARHNAEGQHQKIWRVYRTCGSLPTTSYTRPASYFWGEADELEGDPLSTFDVYCYHIGHDGSAYGAVRRVFRIVSFPGERDIRGLEVYPLRFNKNPLKIVEKVKKQGTKYQETLHERHLSYNNWTLTLPADLGNHRESNYERIQDNIANVVKWTREKESKAPQWKSIGNINSEMGSEFVESYVIVDFEEAFKMNAGWKPTFHRPTISKSRASTSEKDDFPVQVWSDRSRSKLAFSVPDMIQPEDGVELRQRHDNLVKGDPFLRGCAKESLRKKAGPLQEVLRPEDLVLLPKHIFGYALRERKFVVLDVNHLKPVSREEGVFNRLEIWPDYKDILRGLVKAHFQKKGPGANLH